MPIPPRVGPPQSTYRLQISAQFTLFDAAGIVPYLAALGVDWVYLSPLLRAEPGSNHGYDVVDHSTIDPDRGGPEGLDALVVAAREAGLGILIDIVPNHVGVAIPRNNAWWWDLLRLGRASEYADFFDIDWEFGRGRIRIPVLGDDSLADLQVMDGELRYFDHRFPLAPGSADDGADAQTVHSRQNYELINWRRADYDLNYRRFFAVNELAAIRVEDQDVFERSHVEIRRWFAEGIADGLRVDHPDGLRDPQAYLDRLAELTGDGYVLVEKILEGRERLPASWRTQGTTGYDALADFDRVLVDPAGEEALSTLDGAPVDYDRLVHETKRAVADGILNSEARRIQRELHPAGESCAGESCAGEPRAAESSANESWAKTDAEREVDAIAEVLACFPVYRTYLPDEVGELRVAVQEAARARPDLARTIDELWPILSDADRPAALRFQQTSGMVMAKGVEDRAFYRYNRLTSLTEVGADPKEFAVTVDEFAARQQARLAEHPQSMTTLSTHDTKRGEDTRARISALSEVPQQWSAALSELRALAPLGDPALENLLWQAIVGSWPASRERLHAYAEKAAREAGNSTNWIDPDPVFEDRMHALVDAAFDRAAVGQVLEGVLGLVRSAGWSNSLSLKLLQLTAPGVPDVYQGSELWETSLVDPDNRRPVDFAERVAILARLDGGELPPVDASGAAKALVTSRALRLRRARPELFTRFDPLAASGAAASHAVVFDRGGAITVATRLPISLKAEGGWADATLDLPYESAVDVLTGQRYAGRGILLSNLLARYPVALLCAEDGETR